MKKSIICAICVVGMLVVCLAGCTIKEAVLEYPHTSENITVATGEFEKAEVAASKMTLGWNAGNALDSYGAYISGTVTDWETAWGSAVITEDLIKELKNAGFQVIRIPVTWMDHMDEKGNVDEAWMDRVEEVVQYILNQDMYCIINVHHDAGAGEGAWLRADEDNIEEICIRFEYLWTQIATRFEKYDEKLLFGGYNEVLDENNSWSASDAGAYRAVNILAQTFVDAVRATGGKNATRNLIITTYSADPTDSAVNALVLPTDVAEGHLMVEVHSYKPDSFTTSGSWIHNETAVFDEDAKQEIGHIMSCLNTAFAEKGIPVVIGEFGAQSKDNDAERAEYAQYMMTLIKQYNMVGIWWDDCGSMKLIDRHTFQWTQTEILEALKAGTYNP